MRKLFIALCITVLSLAHGATALCTDFYYLTIKNNIGIPSSTFPAAGTIGYRGETHPQYPGYPATQDVYAQPPDGYVFTHWTGDVPTQMVNEIKITLVMNRSRTITANFKARKHVTISTRGYIHSSPLLYDINQDGYREIIVGDMAGYIYCFNHAGNLLWEYYAGTAFSKSISPVPQWFNPEAKNNNAVGNITVQSSCAAGDIDGDTVPEIIVGIGGYVEGGSGGAGGTTTGYGPVGQGGILILNGNGTLKLLVRGWDTFDGLGNPVQDGFSDGFYSSPALFDLNKDGKLDFVIGGTDQNIYAFKAATKDNSRDSSGNTIRFYHPPGKDGFWVVPLFELDDDGDGKFNEDPVGDGTPFTYYNTSDDRSGYVGVDDDGDGLIDEGTGGDDDEDSCQQIGYVNWNLVDEDEFEWPFRNVDTTVSSPAVADLDNSGTAKIIIGCDSAGGGPVKSDRKYIPRGGALRVLTTQADEVGDFPQWIEQTVYSSPSVIDIDNDGRMEIFVGTGTYYTTGGEWKGKGLYAFRSDGTPYIAGSTPIGLFAATQNVILVAPAFGDLNGDGYPEVIAADLSGYLYAWNRTGTLLPGFPMLPLQEHPGDKNTHIKSSPILVDVDGDHLPEIVLGVGWSIVAVNGDGSIVPEFRYGHTSFTTGTAPVFAGTAAADLDNNGKLDLVWTTGVSSDGGATIDHGVIHLWEMDNFDRHANPWPSFKRTGTRNAAFALQLENPHFNPPIALVEKGQSMLVSIDLYEGLNPVSSAIFQLKVNGSTVTTPLFDDGTHGDARAQDGRYTGIVEVPEQINSIGDVSFSATSVSGHSTQLKAAAIFSHLNTLNLTTKYYNDILDRPPEPGGAEGWTAEVERVTALGMDVKEGFIAIGKFFFNSDEYVAKYKTNAAFVIDLYQAFLNRTPGQSDVDYWAGYLAQGLSRNIILNCFAYCTEFREYMDGIFGAGAKRPEPNLVNDFYRGLLNRLPDTGGFNSYLALMRTAQCSGPQQVRDLSSQVALGFLRSAEYTSRHRTNAQFVEDLYNGILRRGAVLDEINYWVNFLNSGTYNREQELAFFTTSAEFQLRVQEVIEAGCLSS